MRTQWNNERLSNIARKFSQGDYDDDPKKAFIEAFNVGYGEGYSYGITKTYDIAIHDIKKAMMHQ